MKKKAIKKILSNLALVLLVVLCILHRVFIGPVDTERLTLQDMFLVVAVVGILLKFGWWLAKAIFLIPDNESEQN
jgi:multisubunit Na+/H+ antiporter MnhF subunit